MEPLDVQITEPERQRERARLNVLERPKAPGLQKRRRFTDRAYAQMWSDVVGAAALRAFHARKDTLLPKGYVVVDSLEALRSAYACTLHVQELIGLQTELEAELAELQREHQALTAAHSALLRQRTPSSEADGRVRSGEVPSEHGNAAQAA